MRRATSVSLYAANAFKSFLAILFHHLTVDVVYRSLKTVHGNEKLGCFPYPLLLPLFHFDKRALEPTNVTTINRSSLNVYMCVHICIGNRVSAIVSTAAVIVLFFPTRRPSSYFTLLTRAHAHRSIAFQKRDRNSMSSALADGFCLLNF